jgi:hypothetical protein
MARQSKMRLGNERWGAYFERQNLQGSPLCQEGSGPSGFAGTAFASRGSVQFDDAEICAYCQTIGFPFPSEHESPSETRGFLCVTGACQSAFGQSPRELWIREPPFSGEWDHISWKNR